MNIKIKINTKFQTKSKTKIKLGNEFKNIIDHELVASLLRFLMFLPCLISSLHSRSGRQHQVTDATLNQPF